MPAVQNGTNVISAVQYLVRDQNIALAGEFAAPI